MLAALLEQLSRGHFILEVRHVRDLDAEIWNNNIVKGVKKIVGKRIFNLYGLCWIGGKSANQVPIKKLDLSHPGITGKLMKISTARSVPIAAQGNLRKTQSFSLVNKLRLILPEGIGCIPICKLEDGTF